MDRDARLILVFLHCVQVLVKGATTVPLLTVDELLVDQQVQEELTNTRAEVDMLRTHHSKREEERGGASPHLHLAVASSRIREDSLERVDLPAGEGTEGGVAMVRCLKISIQSVVSQAIPISAVCNSQVRLLRLPLLQ